MNKKSLHLGTIVQYKNGSLRIVIEDILVASGSWNKLDYYNDNLKITDNINSELDIIKVYDVHPNATDLRELNSALNDLHTQGKRYVLNIYSEYFYNYIKKYVSLCDKIQLEVSIF